MQNRGCIDHLVDDVLAHTMDWESHISRLRELFGRIRAAGLTIQPSKCMFYWPKDIGLCLAQGWEMQHCNGWRQAREDTRDNGPKDKTAGEIFLGLAGYYRRFIPSYAEVAAPLMDLTKRANQPRWNGDIHSIEAVTWRCTHIADARLPQAIHYADRCVRHWHWRSTAAATWRRHASQ